MRKNLIRTAAIVLFAGCLTGLGAKTAREVAGERYQKARLLLDDLAAVPSEELGEKQYLLVIDALKSVHRATPASSYCDDALLAVGDVYAAMAGRFGPDPWRQKAAEAYRYLIQEYPHSGLIPKARSAIQKLESGAAVSVAEVRRPPAVQEEREQIADEPAPEPRQAAHVSPADAILRPASHLAAKPGEAGQSRAAPTPDSIKGGIAPITAIRHFTYDDFTRIVVDADDYTPYKFDFLTQPSRMYFDLLSAKLNADLRLGVELEVGDPRVQRVRAAQNRVNKVRVVLDLQDEVYYDISWLPNPPRLVIDLRLQKPGEPQALTRAELPPPASEPELKPAAAPEPEPEPAPAAVAAKVEPAKPQSFEEAFRALTAGRRTAPPASQTAAPPPAPVVRETVSETPPSAEPAVHLAKAVTPPPAVDDLPPPKPAEATSRGNQSLIRALGLKIGRVVIDAGHGGHDTGMIGPTGLREKDVVLDVSLRLGKLIESRLGAEVIYTREDDRFLELSDRSKVANNAKADLFISVHANAYSSAAVRGVETFYLNFTTDPWALKVASRENAASSHSVHELQDLLGKIALKEKIDESREFALKMQGSLYAGLSQETAGLKNRGVRQAPLIVLIGAKMPAILTEIGFLSNPTDEKLFKSGAYRDKVAEKLFDGIESYVKTLSSHPLSMTEKGSASASLD